MSSRSPRLNELRAAAAAAGAAMEGMSERRFMEGGEGMGGLGRGLVGGGRAAVDARRARRAMEKYRIVVEGCGVRVILKWGETMSPRRQG